MSTSFFKVGKIRVANIYSDSELEFFGIATNNGSNFETEDISGISHFAEHMFFKGTNTRTWDQINKEFAKLGVSNNAYTDNSEVMYHARFPRENTGKLVNLMTDMFFNSSLPEKELDKERNVVLEEMKTCYDDPKYAFMLSYDENVLKFNIGHPIIGDKDCLMNVDRNKMRSYLNKTIDPDNFIFVFSGKVSDTEIKEIIESNYPDESHPYLRPSNGLNKIDIENPFITPVDEVIVYKRNNIEQATVIMSSETIPITDKDFAASQVLNKVIGGGGYSMLFSRIREELGLCYSVHAFNSICNYPDLNMFTVYGNLSFHNIDLFIEESKKILDNVYKNGISDELFECAKNTTLAYFLAKFETSSGKANGMALRYLHNRNDTIDDVIAKYREITKLDCERVAERILGKKMRVGYMVKA